MNNNRKLLRTSRFNPTQRSFLNRRKEYIKAAGGFINIQNATKEELLEVRKKILRQRRSDNRLIGISVIILIPLFVYISFTLFKTSEYVLSAEERILIQEKDDFYTFLITDGDGYIENGKWHNAIFQYKKALELFPNNYDAKYRLGYAYTYRCRNEGKDCIQGSEYLDKLILKYPNKSELTDLRITLEFEDSALD